VRATPAAWFQATGASLSLSEQQLVDCSWDSGEYGNNGCGGGCREPAQADTHLSYESSHF